ncbi:MAG: cellulase family glycosylhydrolase [Rudaea sp.]
MIALRRWLARAAVFVLVLLLAAALSLFIWRDNIHSLLADWTGEEDTSYQFRGLAIQTLALFQPHPDTADFASMANTDLPPFGINTFLEQEVEESKVTQSLQLIHDAGFRFIRQEFPWEDIEKPGKGQFWDAKYNHSTWDKYDRIVEIAGEYGIQVVARLDHPPNWTRHDGAARGNFAPPDNYQDYGDFVSALVSRYKGKVKYYQLWNEPNICCEWGNQPVNAADYTRLLKIGYAAVKKADPNAVVISAGLAPTKEMTARDLSDTVFLQQMYDAGARGSFDVLGVQDYGLFTGPGDRRLEWDRMNFSRPLMIRGIMVKNGDADKPIWAMEVGWNVLPASFKDTTYGRVSEEQQARYAVQAYTRAQEEWPWMGPMMYWFFRRVNDSEMNQAWYYYRMFEPDFTPHPVYAALKDYIAGANWLGIGWHQESDWALDYGGDWKPDVADEAAAGAYRVGYPGAQLHFRFHGTDAELALLQNPYSGAASVRVDGAAAREIDLRATDPAASGRIALARGLRDGEHKVDLTVTRGQLNLDGVVIQRTNAWLLTIAAWAAGVTLAAGVAWFAVRRYRRPLVRGEQAG